MNIKYFPIAFALTATVLSVSAQVDYSVVTVNEESGLNFTRITSDNDYVCMPQVQELFQGKIIR